MIKYILVCKK